MTEPTARAKNRKYTLPFADESHRIVEGAIRADDAMDLLVTAPALGLADALKKVETMSSRSGSSAPRTSARSTTSGSTPSRSSTS